MKIFTGGFHHESDTFNPIITGVKDILVRRNDDFNFQMREDSLFGIISRLRERGHEVVTSLHARAVPNGEWDKDIYLYLKNEFINSLKNALPIDGICLALHGSMRVNGIGKAETDLLRTVKLICQNTPIVVALDMHATITEEMLSLTDGVVGYKCAPHTDTVETGEKAADMLLAILDGKKYFMSSYRVPMLIAGEQSETSTFPMKKIMDDLRRKEIDEDVLSISLFMGFPWADVAENGVTALAIATTKEKASNVALAVANNVIKHKDDFCFCTQAFEMQEAIIKCKEELEKNSFPIILSDSGDNPTAGSSGDVTNFLQLLLKEEKLKSLNPPLVYQAFYDPEVVNLAFESGINSVIKGSLGAKFDKLKSSPINFEGRVISLCENFQGTKIALINIDGIDVVVTHSHIGCYEPEMMRKLNINPEDRKVIVVKLGYLEPELKSIANASILVLSDGSSDEIFTRLNYKALSRPIFPLDNFELKAKQIF